LFEFLTLWGILERTEFDCFFIFAGYLAYFNSEFWGIDIFPE